MRRAALAAYALDPDLAQHLPLRMVSSLTFAEFKTLSWHLEAS